MKLRHVKIENFRGITSLELELGDTTVLIGENNTGKTAVLDAIRFALRDIRSRRGCAFDAYDFHLPDSTSDPANSQPISIRLTFREDMADEWDEKQVARLNRAKIAQVDATTGCVSVILKVGAYFEPVAQDFVHHWEFQNLAGVALAVPDTALSTLQNEVSYYYLAALRDAAKHFDAKGAFWRPFLKESQLTPEKRTEIESKLSEINQLIISSHGSFGQVVERLKDVQEVVSTVAGGEDFVSIDAVPSRLFDMLAKAQISLNTCTGAKIPVGRHGEGTQSLAVLMLFNAYLQAWNKGVPIIALEEPEAHLHPSAVRALWQLIDRIPGQKIISTHSGDLLSEVPSDAVTRLYKKNGVCVSARMKDVSLSPSDSRKFNFHIRRARGELLFARCWILGEGETEASLLPEAAKIMQKDLERSGVRFVTYQTGISLESCLKVANGMGIHWVVLADNDTQGARDHQVARAYLNGRLETEALFVMPEENIEQHLCVNGFSDIYYALLTEQPLQKVTLLPGNPQYPIQVAKALPSKLKTHAAQHVITAMLDAPLRPVPQLFQNVINKALILAEMQ
ncbi:MAG: DUF2813 domain-containing protein [Chlorobium sp.]|nr:DUF2813 domain-containing protein [Chlorobium sp.]